MAPSPIVRRRLEVQGFVGLDDETLAQVAPWLRLSPALCSVLMGLGTALASPSLLWVTMGFALLGAVLPFHPFDLLYNYGIRRWTGTPRLPPNGVPRRFACGMAAAWLAGTALAFQAGANAVGYVLGAVLTAVGVLVSATDICVPSLTYRALFGRR
jgi:hypothetical protein